MRWAELKVEGGRPGLQHIKKNPELPGAVHGSRVLRAGDGPRSGSAYRGLIPGGLLL